MRVLVTGMGGELGTRVAQLLETEHAVELVAGFDALPPRRRLRRAQFHRVEPGDEERVRAIAGDVKPTDVVHLGVYEPDARVPPARAAELTATGTTAVMAAVRGSNGVDHVVVRSGIEVYGPAPDGTDAPDEDVAPDPASAFGRSLVEVERAAAQAGVPVTVLRFAPVAGAHYPSPLGRYLRLPVVPVEACTDRPLSLLHQEDAALAVVAALRRRAPASTGSATVNVVGPGPVGVREAARLGGRPVLALPGPVWWVARRAAELAGAPTPDHVVEALRFGRVASGSRAESVLGLVPRPTADVVRDLYAWAPVALSGLPADA